MLLFSVLCSWLCICWLWLSVVIWRIAGVCCRASSFSLECGQVRCMSPLCLANFQIVCPTLGSAFWRHCVCMCACQWVIYLSYIHIGDRVVSKLCILRWGESFSVGRHYFSLKLKLLQNESWVLVCLQTAFKKLQSSMCSELPTLGHTVKLSFGKREKIKR